MDAKSVAALRVLSAVEPRTSANKIATSTSAPPAGSTSQQRLQRLGFLREGVKPAAARTRPAGPPNGLLHILHRGADGRYRNSRRALTNGAWPCVSTFCHGLSRFAE